ncbi:prepilin peptidase [Sphingopyxis sp. PAMC25046]|nr:prepilin peptidase [Sphingopyxis sp. PAMC25046]
MGIALAALAGLILGSFIATLALRWPAGRSVSGRSQCDACGRPLGVPDLIPLLSFLAARGRCRTCSAPIDRFHSLVEAGSALIGAVALALIPGTTGWLWAFFGWLLLPLALLDARHFWLPDRLSALLAVAGLLLAEPLFNAALFDRWIGAVAGGIVLAFLAWAYGRTRGAEGMGGGDPKLVAAIGCWTGWQALPLLLLLASAGGIGWALSLQRKGDRSLAERRIPFGVFLCAAAFAAVPVWRWVTGR